MKFSDAFKRTIGWILIIAIGLLFGGAGPARAGVTGDLQAALQPAVGPRDAVLVTAPDHTRLVAIHPDRLLVPASILKVLTALAAIGTMGATYRFPTDFSIDGHNNLIIKGYGDPLLISECIDRICRTLSVKVAAVHDLVLDNTYFDSPIMIPGRGESNEPYDAPNGALCVNFNTVAFRRQNSQWVTDEQQTPLLPVVIPKITASGLTRGRITLAADSNEALQYTGELFRYFLIKNGIEVHGNIRGGIAVADKLHRVYRYRSETDLLQVISKLLEFSNNFIANQLLLTMGAQRHGPPATVQKGLLVLTSYYRDVLQIKRGTIVEASGISRRNRICAQDMMNVLASFEPYYELMRRDGRQYYKTGHLKGVRSRAGFLIGEQGHRYRFVVIINTPGKSTHGIMRTLERYIK
jgi:D-alanyl-D-alanine carboxypeptidase/D-alanyl-D-alanine-endopeptidase (penicillin-binding protein 4)